MVSQYHNQPTRSCLHEFFVVNICKITVQRICFEKKDRTGYRVRDIIKLSRYKGSAWKETYPNMQQSQWDQREASAKCCHKHWTGNKRESVPPQWYFFNYWKRGVGCGLLFWLNFIPGL